MDGSDNNQQDTSHQIQQQSFASLLEDDGSASCLYDESIVTDAKKQAAYMPYTSGTTGSPKGTIWSHYGMALALEILRYVVQVGRYI